MASLESDELNIIEAEEINWRLIVYPVLVIAVLLLGGFGIYYYQLNQREQAEEQAAAALSTASTPDDMAKVADQFPDTTQASVALMRAADLSFTQKDYAAALKDYQRAIDSKQSPPELRESAQLGLASAQEASGKADDAIQTYLDVAHKGNHSPFAPVAFHQIAAIYASRQDKANETQILQQAVQLGGNSPFVKEAADQLKELAPASAAASASTTNAAPTP
jgi:predicted negative regulator of RcsB-dependent stress response